MKATAHRGKLVLNEIAGRLLTFVEFTVLVDSPRFRFKDLIRVSLEERDLGTFIAFRSFSESQGHFGQFFRA